MGVLASRAMAGVLPPGFLIGSFAVAVARMLGRGTVPVVGSNRTVLELTVEDVGGALDPLHPRNRARGRQSRRRCRDGYIWSPHRV
jgi:hypothetical protein